MMKMYFSCYIYIFFTKKKKNETKKLTSEDLRKEAIEQTRTTVLVFFYIYVQVKPFKYFFFLTHSTKRKSDKTIVQFCPSVIIAAAFLIYWGGGD